jgi:hypothetical protein
LPWENIEAIGDINGEIISTKLRAYAGDAEEYNTFMTADDVCMTLIALLWPKISVYLVSGLFTIYYCTILFA